MKNQNFFSNKLALVAIVAVSSIMLMSFQNADSKKQSNCFAQAQMKTPDLVQTIGKMPLYTGKVAHVTPEMLIFAVGGVPSITIIEREEKRMSKF